MTTAEQRQHPRHDFEGRAWCEHKSLTLYLPVSNVSAGGIFIQTGTPMSTGQKLKVTFGPLEDGAEDVVAKVEIVWVGKTARGAGVGCRLISFVSGEESYERFLTRLPP